MKRALSVLAVIVLFLLPLTAQAPSPIHTFGTASADSTVGASASAKSTVTASVNVKASQGNVYGIYALNGAASTCWVQLINSASAGTIGTGVIASFPLPASTTQPVYLQFTPPVGGFTAGIAVGIATTATGSTPCGTGGNLTVTYK